MRYPRTAPLVAALTLLLSACGGGGGSEEASPPPASNPPPTTADFSCGLSGFEQEVLLRVNARRQAGASCGVRGNFGQTQPLAWDSRLASAAYTHSRDMADFSYFSHTDRAGRTVADRATAAGYDWRTVGENIAAGQTTVAQVIEGWMASPDHCANIMNPAFVHVAVACAANTGSTFGHYWTMVLAAPR